jgi:hypothetical protein
MGRRIASAANRLIGSGHALVDGKIQTAQTASEEDACVLPSAQRM